MIVTAVQIILLAAMLLVVWLAFYQALPWMARRATVYGLHNVRDRLYDFRNTRPRDPDGQVYRDCELFLTASIWAVRENSSFMATMEDWMTLIRRMDVADWYQNSPSIPANDSAATELHETVFRPAMAYWCLFLMFGHPGGLIFALIVLLPLVVGLILKHYFRNEAMDFMKAVMKVIMRHSREHRSPRCWGAKMISKLRKIEHRDNDAGYNDAENGDEHKQKKIKKRWAKVIENVKKV